jgi:phosphoribosylanthranilate isomerase
VFVNPTEEELLAISSRVPLDVVQLHGTHGPAKLNDSCRVWRSGPATMAREGLDPNVEAWLLDTPSPLHGGSGQSFDWSSALDFPGRAIIAGGLDGNNVEAAIRTANPWGVDACSRLESSPGQKDLKRIKRFVEAALAAFSSQPNLH